MSSHTTSHEQSHDSHTTSHEQSHDSHMVVEGTFVHILSNDICERKVLLCNVYYLHIHSKQVVPIVYVEEKREWFSLSKLGPTQKWMLP